MPLNEEELIACVREYEEIYNPHVKQYFDHRRRDVIWEEIGEKLGSSGEACKSKWKSLRDLFMKSRKIRNSRNDKRAPVVKPWKYDQEMKFLIPFLGPRQQVSYQPSAQLVTDDVVSEDTNISSTPKSEDEASCSSRIPHIELTTLPTSPSCSIPRLPSKRKSTTLSSALLLKEYLEVKKQKSSDAIKKYFEAAEEVVRTFPPTLQVKVKGQIAMILHHAELELLKINNQPLPSDDILPTSFLTAFPTMTDAASFLSNSS